MSEENKNIVLNTNPNQKPSFFGQVMRLLIAVAIVTVVIFVAWFFIKKLIWWLLAIVSLLLLLMNYKFVGKIINWIKQQYNKNAIWGVLVTIAALAALGSGLFTAFLLLKTIINFAQAKKLNATVENQDDSIKKIE